MFDTDDTDQAQINSAETRKDQDSHLLDNLGDCFTLSKKCFEQNCTGQSSQEKHQEEPNNPGLAVKN